MTPGSSSAGEMPTSPTSAPAVALQDGELHPPARLARAAVGHLLDLRGARRRGRCGPTPGSGARSGRCGTRRSPPASSGNRAAQRKRSVTMGSNAVSGCISRHRLTGGDARHLSFAARGHVVGPPRLPRGRGGRSLRAVTVEVGETPTIDGVLAAARGEPVALAPQARERMLAARRVVDDLVAANEPSTASRPASARSPTCTSRRTRRTSSSIRCCARTPSGSASL